jgi:hypothetical protein
MVPVRWHPVAVPDMVPMGTGFIGKKIPGAFIVFHCVLSCRIRPIPHSALRIPHSNGCRPRLPPPFPSGIPQSEIRALQLGVPLIPKKNRTWDNAGQRGSSGTKPADFAA